MRYSPANWLVLHVYKDEKNVLRYRENGLVPQTSWHKPLPFQDDTRDGQFLWRNYLAANKLIINTKLHGDVIAAQQAQKVPPNVHENRIPLNHPSIDICNMDIAMIDVRFKHGEQLSITRKQIITNLFEKLRASGKYNSNKEITEEIAARVCAEVKHIASTLKNFGLITTTRNITHNCLAIDKKSPEYRALQRAVQKARVRANDTDVAGSFSINDLLVHHKDLTASVPIVCPVLGIKLDMQNENAHAAIAVWRTDTRSPLSKTNVAVMSRLASRMIEGKKIAEKTIIEALNGHPEAATHWRQWKEKNGEA